MRPRTLLRIARWEVSKGTGGIDQRTAVIALVGLLLVAGLIPAVVIQGAALDRGIYRVGVHQDSPYYGPLDADPSFAVESPSREAFDRGRLDMLVRGNRFIIADSGKGRAALAALRSATERYNDRRMAREPNTSAAFPVTVSVRYVDRPNPEVIAPGARDGERTGGAGRTGGPAGDDGSAPEGSPGAGDGAGGDPSSDATGSGGGDAVGADGTGSGGEANVDTGGSSGRSGSGPLGGGLFSGTSGGTPSQIAPPFPLESLVLAFVFILPLNFIIQVYGSSILSERINRRGELLLVAPVTPPEIIGGKTLPYLGVTVVVATVTAVVIGGGPVSVLAVVPLALLFLAATFVGAMFARSFKELTFLTVVVSIFLTTYAFIPAIFTDVGSIALISPLTLVVRDLQGQSVALGEYAFSTLPVFLTAGVLFGLGAGVYREEDMFTQRPIQRKVLDALASRIHGYPSLGLVTAILIPFVLVGELLAIATLFALPVGLSLPALIVAVATIEEVAKSLPAYAGFVHSRFDRAPGSALAVGAVCGAGFFVGEKLTLITQLVGLPELRIGRAAFVTAVGVEGFALLAFLLAPLLLHTTTAAISAAGASRGRRWYLPALASAVAIHSAYNLTVVTVLG